MTALDWDRAYEAHTPGWDIGRPQPAIVGLADRGLLGGRVIDAGCGTGEHALLASARGADAVGIDISPLAIGRARARASERGVTARFEVGDVLNLGQPGVTFDTVVDTGMFHVLDDDDRARYAASLASALRSGGTCYLLCFSEDEPLARGRRPRGFRPRRVRQDELRTAFADGWTVGDIAAAGFDLRSRTGPAAARAWLATIHRR